MSDLDVSYVSALSWFFLNLFGLQGIHAIIMGDAQGLDRLPLDVSIYPPST